MVAWAVLIALVFFAGWGARWAGLRVQLFPLLAGLGILTVAGGFGGFTAHRLRIRVEEADLRGPLGLLLGCGSLAWAWLWLGVAGLLRAPVAWCVLIGGLVLVGLAAVKHRGPALFSSSPRSALPERGRIAVLLVLLGATVALPLLLTPPASTDELVYHLAVPQRWVEAGHLVLPPEHFTHAAFPLHFDLLYAWALLLGAPAAAKLVHCAVSVAGVLLAARVAGQAGGREAAWGSAVFVLTLPVALTNFSWAVIDGALAAFVLAGCVHLSRAVSENLDRDWLAAGLFSGFALATKYTAGLYLLVAFVVLLLLGGRVGAFGASLLGRGDDVRLAEMTGEPAGLIDRLGGFLADSLRLGPADESMGFLPLVLLPLMAMRWRSFSSRARAFLVIGAATWLILSVGAAGSSRFLLPALLLLAVPAGESLGSWWQQGGRASFAAGALVVLAAIPNFSLVAWQTRELFDPVKVMLGVESREAWLSRTERGHGAIAHANAELPDDARILALWSTRLFYLKREVIVSGPADVPWIRDRVREAGSLEALVADLKERGVTHLLFDAKDFQARVMEGPSRADWTDGELQVLHDLLDDHAQLLVAEGRVALYALP
jgi:hypothetical protein